MVWHLNTMILLKSFSLDKERIFFQRTIMQKLVFYSISFWTESMHFKPKIFSWISSFWNHQADLTRGLFYQPKSIKLEIEGSCQKFLKHKTLFVNLLSLQLICFDKVLTSTRKGDLCSHLFCRYSAMMELHKTKLLDWSRWRGLEWRRQKRLDWN